MRGRLQSCLLVLLLSPPVDAAAQSRFKFFPPDSETRPTECPLAPVSDFENGWFSGQLSAAGEPSLYEQSLKQPAGVVSSYRFTWLRSFHTPIMIRIDERPGGLMQLTAKRLTGKGGYDPGHVGSTVNRPLTAQEGQDIRRLFSASDFKTFKVDTSVVGLDGAQWILETRLGNKYCVANQWSPTDGPVRRIGMMLLSLTGWKTETIY
jgi:hypothetical protein